MGNLGDLGKLGITVKAEDVSSELSSSSYGDTVSGGGNNVLKGSLVKWENIDGKEIVWMMTDKTNIGIVIHSDNLVPVGTTTNIKDYIIKPFIGTVNIVSAAKE